MERQKEGKKGERGEGRKGEKERRQVKVKHRGGKRRFEKRGKHTARRNDRVKRRNQEKKGGKKQIQRGKTRNETRRIGYKCKRRCFPSKGRRVRERESHLSSVSRIVRGDASCGVCFSSQSTRDVIVRVVKGVQDRGLVAQVL